MKSYDVVIVGGGPAGLSAALTFGRGRARALLVDGGTPRNARAHQVHNFVTRDGTPPAEFRALARQQLAAYPSVEVKDGLVSSVERLEPATPTGEAFVVSFATDSEAVRAERVLLATGLRDMLPAIEGLSELWGNTVFQCPYCHGWELRDRPWGMLADSEALADFAPLLTNWASHLTVFSHGFALSLATQERLRRCGMTLEVEPIARLRGGASIEAVELASGKTVPCSALLLRPAQTAVDLVLALGLERDEAGYVRVDPLSKESSLPGVHVVGDATTARQAAVLAAADGMAAAAAINHARVFARLARGVAAGS